MFFEEKIKSVKENDKVLEIGPGSFPHPRADVFLELKFETEKEAKEQRGDAEKTEFSKPVIYYDGKEFPFKDNEFDYVICSHVLEHIPVDRIFLFLSEMQRISLAGYIEFPRVFYELTRAPKVHLSMLNAKDKTILILDKNDHCDTNILKLMRSFYNHNDPHAKIYEYYKDFFFVGFEWQKGEINHCFVKDINELISAEEFDEFNKYFKQKQHRLLSIYSFEEVCRQKFKHKPFKFIKELFK